MPHITLVYPFRRRREFGLLAEQLVQACADMEAFEIELSTLSWFRHRSSYTVWLAPEPKKALVDLQSALWRVVPDCDEVRRYKDGFTPHLSVGQVRGRAALDGLLTDLERAWTPVRFVVSGVSLIWRRDPPDDVFRVGRSVGFGGTSR
jgi:2'-5' RNA ligase